MIFRANPRQIQRLPDDAMVPVAVVGDTPDLQDDKGTVLRTRVKVGTPEDMTERPRDGSLVERVLLGEVLPDLHGGEAGRRHGDQANRLVKEFGGRVRSASEGKG